MSHYEPLRPFTTPHRPRPRRDPQTLIYHSPTPSCAQKPRTATANTHSLAPLLLFCSRVSGRFFSSFSFSGFPIFYKRYVVPRPDIACLDCISLTSPSYLTQSSPISDPATDPTHLTVRTSPRLAVFRMTPFFRADASFLSDHPVLPLHFFLLSRARAH